MQIEIKKMLNIGNQYSLQKPQRELILEAIEKLTHKPAEGDIKRMLEAAEIFTNSIPLQRKGVSL